MHCPVRVGMCRFSTEQNPGAQIILLLNPKCFPNLGALPMNKSLGTAHIAYEPQKSKASLTLVLHIGQSKALPETTDALELQSV